MRFTTSVAALAAVMLSSYPLGLAQIDSEDQDVLADNSQPASSPPPSIRMPSFTPTTLTAPFLEQFTTGWDKRWKPSHAKKEVTDKGDENWAYVGEWSVEEPTVYKGMNGDKGLVVKNAAAHHAISAKFPKKIDPKGKTLVVQYEVKLQNGLECGGAYLKLLREQKTLHQEEFSNTTPYVIMFGPDKCGMTNKVHFIFNHKNPKSGKYEEKHLVSPPAAKIVKTTELYTLIVHPNNTYLIKQNGEQVKTGSLLEDFAPAVNPAKEIDDPKDEKPTEWVDEPRIADPDATKPDDWDEDAPYEILDDEATIPDDWLEMESKLIPDPEAQKPKDWDDDEDGDWAPPTIPNPKCLDVSGCGTWVTPMKTNPQYKGKWNAPLIDNPAYKGEWSPRKIKNPDYFEDKTPANFEPMGAIGFEIWTMQNNILFDNIYIGHSVADADKLAAESFAMKLPVEKAAEEKEKPKDAPKTNSPSNLNFLDDPIFYIQEKVGLFFAIAQNDPLQAVKFLPEVAAGLALALLTSLGLVVGLAMSFLSPTVAKADAVKVKQVKVKGIQVLEPASAATTGAEPKIEATKRTVAKSAPE